MRFLLDTANVEEIKKWSRTSAIAGVTTNPSLVAKEGKRKYEDLLCEIVEILHRSTYQVAGKCQEKKHLSVEVTTLDPTKMLAQAISLNKLLNGWPAVDVYVKIPVMLDTLEVLTKLRNDHYVKTNATACMTALQAKLAADAGANVVSFFYNRMIDHNLTLRRKDGQPHEQFCDEAREKARLEIGSYIWQHRHPVPFIAGSIRKASDVEELAADNTENLQYYVTCSSKVLGECLLHPKTTEAIESFQKDITKWLE